MCPTNIFFNRKNDDNLFELRKPSSFREISNMIWLLKNISHICVFVGRMLHWLLFFSPKNRRLILIWIGYGTTIHWNPMDLSHVMNQQLTVLMNHITYVSQGFPIPTCFLQVQYPLSALSIQGVGHVLVCFGDAFRIL